MIEHHLKSTSIGVQKLDNPDEQGNTFRLVVIDGQVDPSGNLIPGSGSGQVFWIYMDDPAASTIRQGLEDASTIARPGKPKLAIPRGRL